MSSPGLGWPGRSRHRGCPGRRREEDRAKRTQARKGVSLSLIDRYLCIELVSCLSGLMWRLQKAGGTVKKCPQDAGLLVTEPQTANPKLLYKTLGLFIHQAI